MEFKKCRLCRSETGNLIYIFVVSGIQSNAVAEVISDILQIDVTRTDNYPPFVCQRCLNMLTEFKIFKDLCKTSKKFYDDEFLQRTRVKPKSTGAPSVDCRPISLKEELGIYSTDADGQEASGNGPLLEYILAPKGFPNESHLLSISMPDTHQEEVIVLDDTDDADDTNDTDDTEDEGLSEDIGPQCETAKTADNQSTLISSVNKSQEEFIVPDKIYDIHAIEETLKKESYSCEKKTEMPKKTSFEDAPDIERVPNHIGAQCVNVNAANPQLILQSCRNEPRDEFILPDKIDNINAVEETLKKEAVSCEKLTETLKETSLEEVSDCGQVSEHTITLKEILNASIPPSSGITPREGIIGPEESVTGLVSKHNITLTELLNTSFGLSVSSSRGITTREKSIAPVINASRSGRDTVTQRKILNTLVERPISSSNGVIPREELNALVSGSSKVSRRALRPRILKDYKLGDSDSEDSNSEDYGPENYSSEESEPERFNPEISMSRVSKLPERVLRESVPQHTMPRESVPKHTMPCEFIPQHTMPRESVPQHTMPCESIPQHTMPREFIPQHPMPRGSILPEHVSNEIVPQESVTHLSAHRQSKPRESAEDKPMPDESDVKNLASELSNTDKQNCENSLMNISTNLRKRRMESVDGELPSKKNCVGDVERRRTYLCKSCGKTFVSHGGFSLHMKLTHSQERLFKCETCEETYKTNQDLKLHSMSHSNTKPLSCQVGGMSFRDKHESMKHELAHGGRKGYECTHCEKRFDRKVDLETHQVLHDEKVCEGGESPETFGRWEDVAEHREAHRRKKELTCDLCGKEFGAKEEIRSHMMSHTHPHQCDMCVKSFTCASQLATHMRSHTGEKPYPCSVCKSRFATKRGYVCHMLSHLGKDSYACYRCDGRFHRKGDLDKHVEIVHRPQLPSSCKSPFDASKMSEECKK